MLGSLVQNLSPCLYGCCHVEYNRTIVCSRCCKRNRVGTIVRFCAAVRNCHRIGLAERNCAQALIRSHFSVVTDGTAVRQIAHSHYCNTVFLRHLDGLLHTFFCNNEANAVVTIQNSGARSGLLPGNVWFNSNATLEDSLAVILYTNRAVGIITSLMCPHQNFCSGFRMVFVQTCLHEFTLHQPFSSSLDNFTYDTSHYSGISSQCNLFLLTSGPACASPD